MSFLIIWTFLKKYWQEILLGVAAFLLLVFAFSSSRCSERREAKIDTETIQKINSENEQKRKNELREIIEKSNEVLDETHKTDQEIERAVREADRKILEAKNRTGNVSAEELEEILGELE